MCLCVDACWAGRGVCVSINVGPWPGQVAPLSVTSSPSSSSPTPHIVMFPPLYAYDALSALIPAAHRDNQGLPAAGLTVQHCRRCSRPETSSVESRRARRSSSCSSQPPHPGLKPLLSPQPALDDSARRKRCDLTSRLTGSAKKQRPLELQFQQICASINKNSILSNISGHVMPGEMLAVMGPSGCGKTTLLNVLSGRLRAESGEVLFNGTAINKSLKRKVCYVLQEDIFFAHLTLRQTLTYTAQLRLPDSWSEADKMSHVDRIIEVLELSHCQHTKIGEYMSGGLSGGEKKRANIGCELLTDPALLLLDEPSTGLDSSTTYSLMKNLKEYARRERKTIVLTVHQPSSRVFHMFDKLLLLCQGQTAYFGELSGVVDHFHQLGLHIQQHYNPADFILEQIKSSDVIVSRILSAASLCHTGVSASQPHLGADTPYSSTCSLFSNTSTCSSEEAVRAEVLRGAAWSDSVSIPVDTEPNTTTSAASPATLSCPVTVQSSASSSPSRCCSASDGKHAFQHHGLGQFSPPISCRPLKSGGGLDQDSGTSSWSNCPSHQEVECEQQHDDADVEDDADRWPTSFWTQLSVLTARNYREARPRILSRLNVLLTVLLALMSGLVWLGTGRVEDSIDDIRGYIFFSTNYWMLFALFGALFAFPAEQKVVNKERASGCYRLSAYYLARMLGELPLVVVPPALYFCISYPMIGVSSATSFCQLLVFLLLNSVAAESVGVFFGVLCMDMQIGNTVGAIFTCGTQLFGGFLSTHIPASFSWVKYLSIVAYAYRNMQIAEFSNGPSFKCAAERSQYSSCQSGADEISYSELMAASDQLSLCTNLAALICFTVVFRVAGYVVLRLFRSPSR